MNAIVKQLQTSLMTSVAGLDPQQTQLHRPDKPESWSIQQIAEHLTLTYTLTYESFQIRIAKGTPTQSSPTPKQLIMQLAVTTFGYFPTGRKSPEKVAPGLPAALLSGEEISSRLRQDLAALDEVFSQAALLFGNRRVVTHHVLGPINITQWRRFHLIHGEHHVKQIMVIRRAHRL